MPEFNACRVVRIIRVQKTYRAYLASLEEGLHDDYGVAQPQSGSPLEFIYAVPRARADVHLRKKLFSGKHTVIKTRPHCLVRSG